MKHVSKSGAALAAAAFALALSTAVVVPQAQAANELVKCLGVNACKGQAACKTANNECKGQAACKGQGWINATSSDCATWGGKAIE